MIPYLCGKDLRMNQITIIPKIIHDKFAARVVMDDYELGKPIVITVSARRNDGVYSSQSLVYPNPDIDYKENIRMVFFDVGMSHVCQIVGVFINGHEVRTYFTDVEGLTDIQARYDDSLCRLSKTVNMSDIMLSFQVLETRDPKVLQVLDESKWGILADRKAIIEITVPGREEPVTFFVGKNMVNTFTSLTLGLNCMDYDKGIEYIDLPDGIYDIRITGSPSSYTFSRKYLRTDVIRREVDRLWIMADVLCESRDEQLIGKITEIEYLLASAEANVRLGIIKEAHKLLDRVNELVYLAKNCVDC